MILGEYIYVWRLLAVFVLSRTVGCEASDEVVRIQGAGATFPNSVYQDAALLYSTVQSKASVSYSSTGSGGGKCRIKVIVR